jgi:hypothetical protein
MLSGHDCQVTRRRHEYCFEGLGATSCVLLILDSIDTSTVNPASGKFGAWEVWHTLREVWHTLREVWHTLREVWLHIAGSLTHIAGSLVHYGKFAYEYGK